LKKKVLQLCHDYHGPFVSVCRQYVEALPDAEVTTIFIQGERDLVVESAVGGRVEFLQRSGENLRGFKFSQIIRLYNLLGARQFDAVIAHRYKAIYLAGIMSYFRRFPAMLAVAHEHEVFRRITRKLFVTFWCRSFVVAGVSKSVTNNIDYYCSGLKAQGRLAQLPNVLPNAFSEGLLDRESARDKLDIDREVYVVGVTGRLVKKKSLPVLLRAFAKLKNRDDAQLLIVGDGPLKADLEQLAEELDLGDRIRLLGHVPDAGKLVRVFDLFVLPSGSAEAFGLVLLEAMSAGVPVLTSTAPGPSEVVGQVSCQFLEGNADHLANKILELSRWSDEQRASVVLENQQRVMNEFSPAKFRETLQLVLDRTGQ
jgi:glycosyltransferase involved in cell wall biosynthesis